MRSPAASARSHTAAPGAAAGRVGRAAFLLLAALASMAGLSTAHAETRAWLDRNAIAPGEAVTLNIETDQPGAAPDYTPLRDAFTACDARLVILPGLGHALMQEAPQQLVDTMLAAA